MPKHTRVAITLAAAVLGLPVVARAETRIGLNGEWQFRLDPREEGENAGWQKVVPAGTETVRVPHTWGVGPHEEFEGKAWYFRSFSLPPALRGQRVEIHFGASFYRARAFLNGALVGEHEGGHTEWFVDVTPRLAAVNVIAVEVDNRPGLATIPGWAMRLHGTGNIWYDWWHYGGLVRDVWLSVHEAALVRRQRIRSLVEGGAATVSTRVELENHGSALEATLVAKAFAPDDGAPVATAEQQLSLSSGSRSATLSLRIDPVRLWHFDSPNVYRMEVSLLGPGGRLLDVRSDTFGARTVEIRDRGLFLNGERVRLSGMTRHQESPWEGLAESEGTMRRDYDDMKALQVTLTRPVHYPQHPFILDYCDRNGVLLIPEIPMWQFSEAQMKDPRVLALAKQMMREMIEEAANHPSIFAWSVCNESATHTPGGIAYFRTMYDHVKALDPDRYVSYADDAIARARQPEDVAAKWADFVMMNQYFGSWHGSASLLAPTLERIGKMYSDKMFLISEFGLAGMFAPDPPAADRMRLQIARDQMAEFARHDFIAGAMFWCYQDYKSHRNLRPGQRQGFVEMGVVDENRQRHPSYDAWRELNAPVRVRLEWTGGSFRPPTGFHATLVPRDPSELPSYVPRGYRAAWEARDHDGALIASGEQALADMTAPVSVEASWSQPATREVRLRMSIVRPTGFEAAVGTLNWWEPRSGGFDIPVMEKEGRSVPRP
jgi:beta-galactosidase/beta-glucuronidase